MRQQLRRIETTLAQLADHQDAAPPEPLPPTRPQRTSGLVMPSFSVSSPAAAAKPVAPLADDRPLRQPVAQLTQPGLTVSRIDRSQSRMAPVHDAQMPILPTFRGSGFTSHRNAANPALALNLLKAIEQVAVNWQEELWQILRQVQDVYLEGPIIDGWLESYTQDGEKTRAFRYADINCLMNYVDTLRPAPGSRRGDVPSVPAVSPEAPPTGYRLCGLNEDGQLWFRHCPPAQVSAVSLAIARYQRLKLLLTRKQYLETQLGKLAETLVVVRGDLDD